MLRFLRLDFSGFLLVCRVQKNDLKSLMASLKAHYKQINQGHIKLSHECQEILLISGHWWNDGRAAYAQEENFAKLDVIYRSRTNFLSSPEVVDDCLRIILVGNPQSLKVLQATFSKVGLKYNVRKICGLEGNIASVLYRLTPQQMRILRLAHAEGYYNIPRKINTEQLANLLKMEKGTVGEHLRRAEKKMMDFLMSA